MLTDKIIQAVSANLRIENSVEHGEDGLTLVTSCFIGHRTEPVYTHSLDLEPLFAEMESRMHQSAETMMKDRVKVSRIGIPQEDIEHHDV